MILTQNLPEHGKIPVSAPLVKCHIGWKILMHFALRGIKMSWVWERHQQLVLNLVK